MRWPRFRCRWTRAGGCRAPDKGRPRRDVSRVGRWRGQAATGGSRERATQRGEEAVDGLGGRHDRAHRHASCAPGAARDVHVEAEAQEGGPIDAGKRRVERAAKESAPVRDGGDVRGHRKRRTRHKERRRRRSRSARDERRLARPMLRGRPRPQPRPLDARGDGGGGTWLGSRRCHRARALLRGRRRAASCLRFGRARHPARSPWVARRKHLVQPKKGGSEAAEPSPPDARDTLPATSRAASSS